MRAIGIPPLVSNPPPTTVVPAGHVASTCTSWSGKTVTLGDQTLVILVNPTWSVGFALDIAAVVDGARSAAPAPVVALPMDRGAVDCGLSEQAAKMRAETKSMVRI